MQQSTVSDLISTYFAALIAQDRQTLEEDLSDDFTFTSPYDDHISKADFLRGVFREVKTFSELRSRSYLSMETKHL